MDGLTVGLFLAGTVLLIGGAEALVRGASGLAGRFGIPPLVIGLTVVAFGTSSPEMAVSVMSALKGQGDLAFGNVVGSNIFNVLFILGVSALIVPLVVARQLWRIDVPVMIGVSLVGVVVALDGTVSRLEGVLLLTGMIGYTVFLIRIGKAEGGAEGSAASVHAPVVLQLALVFGGLVLLVLGSRWLVAGAVALARAFGLSELIIGLTIVAAGTSLPEVASSVVAAVRGQRDIAVGNVIGSNVFNILAVLGAAAVIAPAGVPVASAALRVDVPVMLAVAVACLPVFFTGYRIDRWEGALFLALYAAYTAFLVLDSQGHDAAGPFGALMLLVVLPLVAVTLAVLAVRALRRPR
ncbi:MAG: calcium/sodium antiporter [Acidobacteria bacterium]|nr:calcium/sodium antiporter [Acidobacteriota bacterium]